MHKTISGVLAIWMILFANCFNVSGQSRSRVEPQPPSWYSGDIHVHRNCGEGTPVLAEDQLVPMMDSNDLSVISLLADMGNGEVKISSEDLLKVNGQDAPQSTKKRIVHWDTEWHWDATYNNFGHQALGGHLVLLGLQNAHQIWEESPYKILQLAKKQNAIKGICHMEYLNDSIQNKLNCCIPIDYPAEAALGNIDFVAEDVFGIGSPNNGNYNSEAGMNAYYKLLNCGFHIGLAAGTDYPCNNSEPFGKLLTYVKVKKLPLTYRKWIEGIKQGRTVVSRDGNHEFLDLRINKRFEPGDSMLLKTDQPVSVEAKWTSLQQAKGRIELVCNGKVIATQEGTARPGAPVTLKYNATLPASGWICARRMDNDGHHTHTAPVYILIDHRPIRASADDAQFFISWIDNILRQIAPGGDWNRYFEHDLKEVTAHYQEARKVYEKIKSECLYK